MFRFSFKLHGDPLIQIAEQCATFLAGRGAVIERNAHLEVGPDPGKDLQRSCEFKIAMELNLLIVRLTSEHLIDNLLLLLQMDIKEAGQVLKIFTEPCKAPFQITNRLVFRKLHHAILHADRARAQAPIVGRAHLVVKESLLKYKPLIAALIASICFGKIIILLH